MAGKAESPSRARRDPRLAAVLAAAILLLEQEQGGGRLKVRETWPEVSPWRYLGRW